MTRCAEFWDKWDRDPNFCGLSPQSISEIKGYLELRDKVVKMGVDKRAFYEKCPSGACRPVLRLADDGTRAEATNYIISCLKRNEIITQGDLKGFVDMRLKKEAVCKVTPKIDRASTQMRTQEQSDAAPVTNTAPYPSLAEQMKSEPYGTQHVHPGPAAINPVIINDTYRESPDRIRYHCVYPDGCRLRDKELVLSPELCGSCKSLRPLTDGKGRIIRESPFRTGADVLHAQKTGIAGEMYPHIVDANKMVSPPKVSPEEQKRIDKQRRIDIAEQLVDAIGRDLPDMVRDILKEHPTWNAADVLYFGVQVLHERKGRV